MPGIQEGTIVDIVATVPPDAVAHPHGRNSFAVENGVATSWDVNYIKRNSVVAAEPDPERSASTVERELYPEPTEEEYATLRKVADTIPVTAYLLCLIEFMERASYYGATTVFANFIQFPLPDGHGGTGATGDSEETAGALNMGLQAANALVLLFTFLAYVVPIFGGWLADTKIGRFRAIILGVCVCLVAHIIMTCGAIPTVLKAGNGKAPFLISLFLLAIGAGIFKPNVAPTIMDQYRHQKSYTKVNKKGEKVVVDPETTIQRIMLWFYMLINIGAFFALATTYSEKYVGYWLAFLLPSLFFAGLLPLLWYLNRRLLKYPPDGSVLNKAFKIIGAATRHSGGKFWKKGYWEAAKPSALAARGITTFNGKSIEWNDKDVDDIKRTLEVCMVFLYFPIYNLNDGGIGSVATSQGSTMTTRGAPNDLLSNFNPLAIIITIPLLSHVIYPLLRKYNINFGRINRMTFGFSLAAISGMIGAIVQWRIYETSPCGYYATGCTVGDGVSPILIWWQLPNVTLGAISECFANVTAYEMAYARAPPGMKALVYAIFLFTTALSSALGEILTPAIIDPHLIWIWAGPAIALAVQTVIFWFNYRHLNNDEFMTYTEEDVFGKTDGFENARTISGEGESSEGIAPDSKEAKEIKE